MIEVPRDSGLRFTLIFLFLLLAMNLLYFLFDYFSAWIPFDPYVFRVIFFMMLLSIMVLVENLLIALLTRHTLLGVILLLLLMLGIFIKPASFSSGRALLVKILSPFLANKYIRFRFSDTLMLFLLNSVVVAFMVTVALKEQQHSRKKNKISDGKNKKPHNKQ